MIYEEPVFRFLGDCYLAIEFGDEANLALSFRVLALLEVLSGEDIRGIVEMQPTMRELAIILDRREISHRRLKETVLRAMPDADAIRQLPSRIVRLPVWYNDPWSAETARRYKVANNLEFVAKHNALTVEEAIDYHTGTQHWSTVIGFHPGSCVHYPLDPSKALTAPKYNTPRDFTPARSVGLGGQATAIYVFASPGGYQLLGRLAVDTFERVPSNSAFPADGVLLRAGDRIEYYRVDALEYDEIRERVRLGRYEYEIQEGCFEVKEYVSAQSVFSSGA